MSTEYQADDFGYTCNEIRRLPTGGDGAVLCGRRGYDREMRFRREQIAAGVPFDLPPWDSLTVYWSGKEVQS